MDDREKIERALVEAIAAGFDTRQTLDLLDVRHKTRFEHWVHPKLLTPSPRLGTDQRGRPHFNRDDVLSMRARLSEALIFIGSDPAPDHTILLSTYGGRSFYTRHFTLQQLIIDILEGHVRAFCRRWDALLSDCLIHLHDARTSALFYKVEAVLANSPYAPRWRVNRVLLELWPDATLLRLDETTRSEGWIPFQQIENRTEGRVRPAYLFHMSAAMAHQARISGPSISPRVDAIIRRWSSENIPPVQQER